MAARGQGRGKMGNPRGRERRGGVGAARERERHGSRAADSLSGAGRGGNLGSWPWASALCVADDSAPPDREVFGPVWFRFG